eukprot:GFYU01027118.1.p1 GENE.GFYU01027118.1~~GFYU01027118.1.p1  ORF type:complete len:320 (-),score=86.11 GFYU01027118.1:233-1123(-)
MHTSDGKKIFFMNTPNRATEIRGTTIEDDVRPYACAACDTKSEETGGPRMLWGGGGEACVIHNKFHARRTPAQLHYMKIDTNLADELEVEVAHLTQIRVIREDIAKEKVKQLTDSSTQRTYDARRGHRTGWDCKIEKGPLQGMGILNRSYDETMHNKLMAEKALKEEYMNLGPAMEAASKQKKEFMKQQQDFLESLIKRRQLRDDLVGEAVNQHRVGVLTDETRAEVEERRRSNLEASDRAHELRASVRWASEESRIVTWKQGHLKMKYAPGNSRATGGVANPSGSNVNWGGATVR